MDSKKRESIDKKANSIEEINKRIDQLSKITKVATTDDWVAVLLEGKPPQYYKRFAAWCRNTLSNTYQQDMLEAMLSVYALNMLKGSNEFTEDFVRGQSQSLLFINEEMARLSNVESFNKKES